MRRKLLIFLVSITIIISSSFSAPMHSAVSGDVKALELVKNGSFEQGVSDWGISDQTSGGNFSVVSDSVDGDKSLQVNKRTGLYPSISQDISKNLINAGNRTSYTASFSIKLEAMSSVRLILSLTSTSGNVKMIMAEKVVRTSGEWVRIAGTREIAWLGALTGAKLSFEIAQITEGIYPSYHLDNLSIQPDDDGDQLTNSQEYLIGSNSAVNDSDHDGLPDGWEVENKLDPLADDANKDTDKDGFGNQQEYWAATNPNDRAEYPGMSANPNASTDTLAVLRYLALLPSQKDKRVLVGQHLTSVVPEYGNDIVSLWQKTGKWAGLLALQYDGLNKPLQIQEVNPYAIDYWKNGGLVKIKWSVNNPWTGGNRNDRPGKGEYDYIDIPGLIDPSKSADKSKLADNQKAHEVYMGWLEQVATGLTELQNEGLVVLWRPLSEMNGGWFWWGRNKQQDYIELWRHMYTYLTKDRGLNNLIWVYESDSGMHELIPSDYYYPGDAFVDVVGHNFYHNTWELPFDANELYRNYPKIYAFPQAGAGDNKDGSWDNMTFLDGIINRYPRCSFFAAWNTYAMSGGKVTVNRAIDDNQNAKKLMEHPWIVTRSDIDWRKFSGISVNLNGVVMQSDVPPMIENGRVLVPLRAILELLNIDVKWDETTKTITFTKGDQEILFAINSTVAMVDGSQITLDVPPKIINNRTMIPVRFLAESIGMFVQWDSASATVHITNPQPAITPTVGATTPNKDKVMLPLTELGISMYQGYQGGLYSGGVNQPSDEYLKLGLDAAKTITSLNKGGRPAQDGSIVLLSIGMSNTNLEFSAFKQISDSDGQRNANVTVVNGAIGGVDIAKMAAPEADYWVQVEKKLTAANVTAQQVQVIWLKQAYAGQKGDFPDTALQIKDGLAKIIEIIQEKYPNVRIIYCSSRTYGGYSTTTLSPEPFAYEGGFGVKWLIEEMEKSYQSKGPWVAWGPYLWANGENARDDGVSWLQSDTAEDGTHPSKSGQIKVANLLNVFFKTDKTAKLWYLGND